MWIKSSNNGHCEIINESEDNKMPELKEINHNTVKDTVDAAIQKIYYYDSKSSVNITDFAKDLLSKYDSELAMLP